MQVKGTPMAASVYIEGACEDCVNSSIYVKAPDGRKWKFQRSFTRDVGKFSDSQVLFATGQDDTFKKCNTTVPNSIQLSYEIAIPVAEKMILDVLASEARIPDYRDADGFKGMVDWWAKMHASGLDFNPEDDLTTIVRAIDGQRTFTDADCERIRPIIEKMLRQYGLEAMFDVLLKFQQVGNGEEPSVGIWTSKVTTVNVGAGRMVDLIHLQCGKVIVINAECVAVYFNEAAFFDGTDEDLNAIRLAGVTNPEVDFNPEVMATDETRSYGPRS